jgi:hypothetical protein
MALPALRSTARLSRDKAWCEKKTDEEGLGSRQAGRKPPDRKII